MIINHKILKALFLVLIQVAFVTDVFAQTEAETIIVKVGNKTITKTEFINRAEFTPRPDYCRLDNYIHRKIVLNTLIAEKMMAIEAGESNELTNSPEYKAYLIGRKEQAMRQIHFYENAYIKSKPDSSTVAQIYDIAGRTYNVSYFRINDLNTSRQAYSDLVNLKISFDSVYTALSSSDTIPTKQISYFNNELPEIHKALFAEELNKGEILEPIFVDDSNIIIRIDGWTDRLAVSDKDKLIRWNDLYKKLTEDKAIIVYEEYVSELMSGKRIEFNRPTFEKLVEITAPYYLKSNKDKKRLLKSSLWKPNSEEEVLIDNLYDVDDIRNLELLKIDDEIWTVEKFIEELKIHPLVFRKQDLRKKNFAEQMKLAIADLIRDKYITQDAYEKGIDKHPLVQRNVALWRDNLLALYQKYMVLSSVGEEKLNKKKVLNDIMNPYVRELQLKHSDIIKINI
ncbi:MAG: hypothetical protein JSW63_06040, partial [Ignavibacterium sp.]